MKTAIMYGAMMSLVTSTPAYAANGVESSGGSLLTWLFLAFVGVIVVMQLIPGVTLFAGMIKGVFSTIQERGKTAEKAKGMK